MGAPPETEHNAVLRLRRHESVTDLIERVALREVDSGRHEGSIGQMAVGVDEPGEHQVVGGHLDHSSSAADQGVDVGLTPDAHDQAVSDGDGSSPGPARIDREHRGPANDEIGSGHDQRSQAK
jgi:hypothetical protein